jgi:O-antigen/teichoic acid export membrane protein
MPISDRQSSGWDIKNAFRNYSTLVAAQVVVAVFSFASVWLITRYLGTDGYGGVVAVSVRR